MASSLPPSRCGLRACRPRCRLRRSAAACAPCGLRASASCRTWPSTLLSTSAVQSCWRQAWRTSAAAPSRSPARAARAPARSGLWRWSACWWRRRRAPWRRRCRHSTARSRRGGGTAAVRPIRIVADEGGVALEGRDWCCRERRIAHSASLRATGSRDGLLGRVGVGVAALAGGLDHLLRPPRVGVGGGDGRRDGEGTGEPADTSALERARLANSAPRRPTLAWAKADDRRGRPRAAVGGQRYTAERRGRLGGGI